MSDSLEIMLRPLVFARIFSISLTGDIRFLRTSSLCLAVSLCALAGCALFQTGQVGEVAPLDASRAEIIAKLKKRRYPRAYRGVTFMQMRFHDDRTKARDANPLIPEGSFSGHAALVLRKPDSLRMEPLSPFGTPLVVVVARGGLLRAYSPARNAVYMGRTNRRGIEGILGIPLNSGIFIKLLLGDWAAVLGGEENLELKKTGSFYVLETRREAEGEVSGFVELEPRDFHPVKMEIRTPRGAIAIRYGGFSEVGGAWRPSDVEILGPGGKNRFRISYPADEGAVDETLPDGLFRLEPPRGARTLWLGG